MLKTVLKIAGVYAMLEVMYQFGKGAMLAHVRNRHPEAGDEMHELLETVTDIEDGPLYNQLMCELVLIGEKVATNLHYPEE